ncbi:HPr family phosphocarrier protein [Coraliomargarita parva]|uniref:HPr family phosphocarrier protein n=1 Tax=Coraliomargarita parva TaxID=3014050 RepID=UPI0022B2E5DB|nr:HPr family phosphocarrier protein [Coraliomargarita parva]
MKTTKVVVPWEEGLHLRPAAELVKVARRSKSTLKLRLGQRRADLRNILSIIALCATMGTALYLECDGEDELSATQEVERIFSPAEKT